MTTDEAQHLSQAQLTDLSALADGSLDPSRRQTVEHWIARSPHLRTLYEHERSAAEMLKRAAAERAPARLRMRIGWQRASRATRARWNPHYGALVAAVAAAVALLLPGGMSRSPSVSQAARLAIRGPSGPGPVPDPGDPRTRLSQGVHGLYFPNWRGALGWRPVGARSDRLRDRLAVTVYYERSGTTVAYTIVDAPLLAKPSAPVTHLHGFAVQALRVWGRNVVTWRSAGHTCVLSASAVPTRALEALAQRESWALTG